MTQLWIALRVYLILVFIKFQSRLTKNLQRIFQLLHLNLFEKHDLMALLRGEPPSEPRTGHTQLALLGSERDRSMKR